MKRLLLAALLLASCDLPAPVFAVELNPVTRSVGLVIMGDHMCSAVLVAPQLAVTAGHCVVLGVNEALLGSEVKDGAGHLWGKVVAAAYAPVADAGFLVLDRPVAGALELEMTPPGPGDDLTLVGYGCAPGLLGIRRGFATGTIDPDGALVFKGRVCKGDSGGAVLDADGRLVGIMAAYNAHDRSVCYATPSAELVALIDATQTR